jgi:hypothetical protein
VGFSISAALDAGGDKSYLRHLDRDGFEMGVGRRGVYDAHAHRGFTDIAFAPGGLVIHQSGGALPGKVHITSPGSWFGPIEFLSDFWFVKFFQSSRDFCAVPDKVTDPTEAPFEGCLVADEIRGTFTFWLPGRGGRHIDLRLRDGELEIVGLDAPGSRLVVVK